MVETVKKKPVGHLRGTIKGKMSVTKYPSLPKWPNWPAGEK